MPLLPVEIYGWVSVVTPGLTRIPTRTWRLLAFGKAADGLQLLPRFHVEMADAGAHGGCELVGGLPHPAEDDALGLNPAARARAISPEDTISAPAPRSRRMRSTARLLLALTAKQILCGSAPRAPSSER